MRVALIQMLVTTDKQKNLDTACSKIKEASGQGAHIAVLPEMFYCPYDNNLFSDYGEEEGGRHSGPFLRWQKSWESILWRVPSLNWRRERSTTQVMCTAGKASRSQSTARSTCLTSILKAASDLWSLMC